jgi:hypothetical protein
MISEIVTTWFGGSYPKEWGFGSLFLNLLLFLFIIWYSGTSAYVLNPFQILGLIPNEFFP